MTNWCDKDIILYEKLASIIKRGYYISGTELADLHNRVFGTKLTPTGCSSCNKMRFQALKKSYEELMNKLKENEKNDGIA